MTFGPPAPLTSMMWEGGRSMFLFSATLNSTCVVAVTVLVLAFAMRFVDEAVGGIGRRQWIAFRIYTAFNVMVLICWCLVADRVDPLPLVGDSTAILGISEYTGIAASLAYLWIGWRRSERQQRERFALFLAGVAALAVSQIIPFIVFVQFGQLFSESHPLLIVAELLSGLVAPLLLTHAILRHRVLDLSFILNRTLVYGTVSAILLISFGLVEWSIEHFVKIEGRERNALVDAAIALAIYLAFHRFRHATEHRLEAFFFREWHAKDAALRRSISQSRFITASEPLVHAATLALKQFSGGAAVTFYLKNPGAIHEAAEAIQRRRRGHFLPQESLKCLCAIRGHRPRYGPQCAAGCSHAGRPHSAPPGRHQSRRHSTCRRGPRNSHDASQRTSGFRPARVQARRI